MYRSYLRRSLRFADDFTVEARRKSLRTGTTTIDILKGIDFTVASGEFVAIMGASGSGKSTLLGLLAGLDNPTSGDVRLNGVADPVISLKTSWRSCADGLSGLCFRAINLFRR